MTDYQRTTLKEWSLLEVLDQERLPSVYSWFIIAALVLEEEEEYTRKEMV